MIIGVRTRCRVNRLRWRTDETYRKYWLNDETGSGRSYTVGDDGRRLNFRTLVSSFFVVGEHYRRTKLYNIMEPLWRLRVCDRDGLASEYIDLPDPCGTSAWKTYLGHHRFAVLSSSTIDGTFEPPQDSLKIKHKGAKSINSTMRVSFPRHFWRVRSQERGAGQSYRWLR
jgi:hypothetical protein